MKLALPLILIGALLGFGQSSQLSNTVRRTYSYSLSPQMHPLLLRSMAMDLKYAVSAVKWLDTLLMVGDRSIANKWSTNDGTWLWRSLRSQLVLDPYTLDTYVVAGGILPFQTRSPDKALQLALHGAYKRTRDWRIFMSLGYLLSFQFEEKERAGKAYALAGTIEGAPGWLSGLAAMHKVEDSGYASALAYLDAVIPQTGNDTNSEFITDLLVMRQTLRDLYAMEQMIDDFKQKFGYSPSGFRDLINRGYLTAVPIDPAGERYLWDSATGQPQSSRRLTPIHTKSHHDTSVPDVWFQPNTVRDLLSDQWGL